MNYVVIAIESWPIVLCEVVHEVSVDLSTIVDDSNAY